MLECYVLECRKFYSINFGIIMTITKKQQIALIEGLFRKIPDFWAGFKLARDDLFAMNQVAEKKHRKDACSSSYNCTVATIAKYFTVMHLFEGMQAAAGEKEGYTIEAILHIRLECLKAQAYAMTNKEKLQAWYDLVKSTEFETLDYCELIK
jgi:hypothetical protein